MRAADVPRHELGLLVLAFSTESMKAEIESIDRAAGEVHHQGAYHARIHATREKAAEGHVRYEHALHRAAQLALEPGERLVLVELELAGIVRLPVAPDRELAALELQRVAGLELAHTPVHGMGR